jgi:ribulose-phosphate 3-epimerase
MTSTSRTAPVKISPSLLSSDFGKLAEEVRVAEAGGADLLHVDVMDGHFVPNLTIGPVVVKAIKKHATVPLDVHLMIADPLQYAKAFRDAGSDSMTFHIEVAREDPAKVAGEFRRVGAKVGVALNPDTPISPILPILSDVDLVLVMTVFPGFAGQSYLGAAVSKVAELRALGFAGDVEVDGGISSKTIEEPARLGANVFVAGSAVFGTGDVAGRIRELRDLAESARRSGAARAPGPAQTR